MRLVPKPKHAWWFAALLSLLFFCTGLVFLPLVGLQDDEVLFGTAVFHLPVSTVFNAHIFGHEIPLMLLSYLGALKSLIYLPILTRIRPSFMTVRLPMLLAGSVSIWLFYRLLERAHNRRVALIGGLLLATDTVYLLTTCFDWGPVALQHLLSITGMLLLLKFASSGSRWTLFGGFFWFGLALWDKALFLWLLSGLVIATLIVFPRELWSRCTPKNLGLAAAGLILGALPLVAYNVAYPLDTFRSNSSFSLAQLPSRWHALKITWDGEILFDYMAHAPWAPGVERGADGRLQDLSSGVHFASGVRYRNVLMPAVCAAMALLPLLWRTPARKPMLFCLIAFAVGWIQMAITKDAGLGAHHVTLLWPLPQWLMALAFVQAAAWRPLQWKHTGTILLTGAVAFLVAENLLLTNEYFYQLWAFGPNKSWTDAIFQLSDEVGSIHSPELVIDDWGILNPLVVLHRNRLPLVYADQSFLAADRSQDYRDGEIRRLANDIWIGHTYPYQQWPSVNERIARLARGAGFEKQLIRTVPDTNGQPVYEIFRFVRAGG